MVYKKKLKMKKFLTTILIVFSIITVNAQSNNRSSNISDGFNINRKNAKGHQFLLDNWVLGYLVSNDGKLSEKMLLNYDIHYNNPTSKTSNEMKDIVVIDKNLYSGFVLVDANENKYIYTKIGRDKFSRKKKEDKYYQLIDAPNKNILLETSKKLKDPNASGWTSSRDNTLSASFVMKTQYYVLNKDKVYVKTKLSSGSVAKALKDQKKVIQSYIKQNKLKFKNVNDLIKVMNYYNSL